MFLFHSLFCSPFFLLQFPSRFQSLASPSRDVHRPHLPVHQPHVCLAIAPVSQSVSLTSFRPSPLSPSSSAPRLFGHHPVSQSIVPIQVPLVAMFVALFGLGNPLNCRLLPCREPRGPLPKGGGTFSSVSTTPPFSHGPLRAVVSFVLITLGQIDLRG